MSHAVDETEREHGEETGSERKRGTGGTGEDVSTRQCEMLRTIIHGGAWPHSAPHYGLTCPRKAAGAQKRRLTGSG